MAVNKARLTSALVGLGPGGGGLQKLQITTYDRHGALRGEPIEALFNPHEISRSRSVTWHEQRVASRGGRWAWSDTRQRFGSAGAETLTLELFFDTYEPRSRAGAWSGAATSLLAPTSLLGGGGATDVTDLTQEIVKLAEVDPNLHRPPVCHLKWGAFDIFDGVLTQLDQRFTLFLADGTPVRATLTCNFVEFQTRARSRAHEPHSADVDRTRVVRRHDTLQSLAAEEYGDPGLWRQIARANGIVNPRDLKPGTVLRIPKLSP